MSTIAFVEKINRKSGTGRNGKPYTLFSMKLSDKDGNELPGWYQCGFDAPPCKEGDYVKLDATKNNKGNFDIDNVAGIKVSKNPPAKPARQSSGGGGRKSGGGGGYKADPVNQARITWQAARNSALSAVELLLANGGLKLRKGDTKAITSANFDLVMEAIDKVTVEFFRDVYPEGFEDELRVLQTVSDAGSVDMSGDGPLPDTEEDEFDEDGPEEPDTDDEFEGGDDDDDFE